MKKFIKDSINRTVSQLGHKMNQLTPGVEEQEALIAGDFAVRRPTPTLAEGSSNNEIQRQMVLQQQHEPDVDEEAVVRKITAHALSEKLRSIIAEEKAADEETKTNVFRPVQAVSSREAVGQQKDKQETSKQNQGVGSVLNTGDLSELLAENMVNVFSNAMQHINSSLVRNLVSSKATEQTDAPRTRAASIFAIDSKPVDKTPSAKKSEDKAFRKPSATSDRPFAENKLLEEFQKTQDENAVIHQHRPVSTQPYSQRVQANIAPSILESLAIPGPQPIKNCSGYFLELESESSSFRGENSRLRDQTAYDTGSEAYTIEDVTPDDY